MLICDSGNAHSPKVIYALPLEIFAFSSESTIGYVSLFSRYQSVALQCFLSVLMLHVLGLSHAVSFGLRAFPPFLGLSSVLAFFDSASVPSETALFLICLEVRAY